MKVLTTYNTLLEDAIQQENLPLGPANLYDPLRYFLQLSGKRMRPMLSLMACKLYDTDFQKALPAALCVEYFHNFSLIHDDIMDAAPLRRGQQTVHIKWNPNIAILSGDVLLVKAYGLLAKYDAQIFKALFDIFNKTAIEVCEGQQMDMDFELRQEVSEAEYIEMIRLKTSVLLGCALQMGGIVGKAGSENEALLYEFGEQLGLAFQIQDDLLDLYGESAQVGKQIGGDVLANKKTLLSIHAKKVATTEAMLALNTTEKLENPLEKIEQTQKLYSKLGAKLYCEEKMALHHSKALTALEKIESTQSKHDLQELAEFLFARTH
ncbi:MAG: polyprenyl synthetase family protein [Sphingomonadales bacterium]|nr:polyprenyl synthetase family protein [Sphingomonadales bacterium]